MFDDSNLWCDDCGNSNSGECNKHGVLHVVSDLPFVSRARQTLPSILELKSPTDSEEGLLVFSRAWIQRRTRFGPLQAPTRKQRPSFSLQIEQLTQRPTLPFKLFRSSASGVGKELSALWLNADESRNEELSNWMVFVAVARTAKEQNLVAFQYQSGIYFVTIKDIAVGEELRVWYAKEYAACMGIAPLPKASGAPIECCLLFTLELQYIANQNAHNVCNHNSVSFFHYLVFVILKKKFMIWNSFSPNHLSQPSSHDSYSSIAIITTDLCSYIFLMIGMYLYTYEFTKIVFVTKYKQIRPQALLSEPFHVVKACSHSKLNICSSKVKGKNDYNLSRILFSQDKMILNLFSYGFYIVYLAYFLFDSFWYKNIEKSLKTDHCMVSSLKYVLVSDSLNDCWFLWFLKSLEVLILRSSHPFVFTTQNGITSIRKIIKAVKDIIEAELSSTIHYLLLILLNDRLLTWFDERNKESNLRKFNQIDSNIFCVLIGDVINRSCSLVPHKNIIDFLNCLLTLHCLYIYFFNFILFIFFWKMYHAFKQLGFLCPNETNIFLYCLGFFIMRGTSYSSSCLSFLQNFNSVFEGIVLERKKIISIAICSFGYVFQMVFIQRCMSDIKYLLFFHLVALSCSSSLSILFSFSSLLIFIFSTNIPKINLFNIVTCYNSADFAIIVLVKPSSYVFNDTLRNFFVVKSAQVCAMVCTRRNNYPFFEIVIHKTVLAKIIFMKRQTVDRKKLLLEQGKKIYNLRSALNIFVLR
ncbi:zinc finger protein 568-like isoform X1, partial [Gryllus bimaculatus]